MKRLIGAFFVLALLASSARADFAKGSQTLSVAGGFGGSSTQYDYVPGNEEPVTGGGGAFGAQYVYYARNKPTLGFGLDYTYSNNGDRTDNDLLDGYNTTQRIKSSVVLGIVKLAYPHGVFRPYIFGGVGVHSSKQTLDAQPQSGNMWPGGGTESRALIDQSTTNAAVGYGVGLDIFPTESFFFGLDLRGIWLAGLNTDDNAALNNAGFTDHSNSGISQGDILFRAGVKF